MKKTLKIALLTFLIGIIVCPKSYGQTVTIEEAIETARKQSVQALEAKQAFISTYWAYRAYQASKLPSLTLYGNIMNFNRSLTLMQSYEDGDLRYVNSYNLQNGAGLRLSQNISLTGGTISIYSDLSRIDQFGASNPVYWYSQPVTISYIQPLFSYNQFKWNDLIEPKEYEKGRREYLESMERLTLSVVKTYYDLLLSQISYSSAVTNYSNTSRMLKVAKERLNIGTVSKDEYLQLELRVLNDSIAINENEVELKQMQMQLNSLLGFDESILLIPQISDALPDVWIDYEYVLDKCYANSSFNLSNELKRLSAESNIAKAKASAGASVSLSARFGLSKSANDFPEVYKELGDQEMVGITFSIPIFDWGVGKGKIEKAKAALEVTNARVAQREIDFRQTIFTAVNEFNNKKSQCLTSKRAMVIASERYKLIMEKFQNGNASVLELNTAQSENNAATFKYINDISNYWQSYYNLRAYTLFDFLTEKDLEINEIELLAQ